MRWGAGPAGSDEQKQEWLPGIVTGEAILTPAWLEPENSSGPTGVRVGAVADGDGWTLTGTKRHVAFASSASRLIVLARTGDAPADVDLFVVDPSAPGVTLTQQLTIASDAQYKVELSGVRVDGGRPDRRGRHGVGHVERHHARGDHPGRGPGRRWGPVRPGDHTQYAKDRHQFDKPLGAFQALAHYLADAATAVDGAEVLVHEAAWARPRAGPSAKLAPMAKLYACRTFRDVTATAQQIFGGIGFTVEFDIQLYFRRAKELQLSWWDPRTLEELIAAQVLDA